MCGIAGFLDCDGFSGSGRFNDALVLDRMTSAIRHRGPDASGVHREDGVALGHRRLSIVDLATGQQPMTNEDGTLWIVYNGEIFNHASLRPELERAGHRYSSRSDTEAVLHAYEQYGPECLSRFRGMFAFALWDRTRRVLFCARDRLGIKPFYYYWDGKQFAFASEIKALLEHPAISAELEHAVVPEFLSFGYTSGEQTLFRGIRKLMPGHWLRISLDPAGPRFEIQQYWDAPRNAESEPHDDEFWIRDCRRRLEETVEMRLMSDVPLGMFLSGGLDSSAIAAIMSRRMSSRVQAFAVGYAETAYSELPWARQVAQTVGADYHEVSVGFDDFFNALPSLVWHEDEPVNWPSSVSLYFVAKLAAEKVKVVLTGEGSDELFAGYARYNHFLRNRGMMDAYRAVPGFLRTAIRGQLRNSSLLSATLRRKLMHTPLGREDSVESLHLDNFCCAFSREQIHALAGGGDPYASFLKYWNNGPFRSPLAQLLYADQKTYLVELLMKQDQMSMACSIESRVPFLDHEFVEFAARVPDHLKLRGGSGKYILKKAVEDLLPSDIIYRKKMGFPTPIRDWLLDPRSAPLYDLLLSPGGLLADILDRSALTALIHRHRTRHEDATDQIWRLLNFQLWGEIFLRKNPERYADGLLTVPSPAAI
jgi:asparagine synthase (glutamine-hydrolysing)